MALWARTQHLSPELFKQVESLYRPELFPIEIRHYLAQWIEEQNWNEIDPDDPQCFDGAHQFVSQMIVKLNELAQNEFVLPYQIKNWVENLKLRYLPSPLELIKILKHCLDVEVRLVQQAESGIAMGSVDPTPNLWIVQQLEELRQVTQQTASELRRIEQEQESFLLQCNEYRRLMLYMETQLSQATDQQKAELEKKHLKQKESKTNELRAKNAELVHGRVTLAGKYEETITGLQQVQSRVLDIHLTQWKREQQLAGNGAGFNNNLDIIQQWCENLAELIWMNRQQIKELDRLIVASQSLGTSNSGAELVSQLRNKSTELLSSLVTSTFVVEKQPPQVMKTNTRFTATVRLLVGAKLNVHMSSPLVKVSILSEAQANALLVQNEQHGTKFEGSGEILNNSGTMEYISATRQLVVNFRNMQLRKIKRAEKKGTESVMDEKFSLLFLCDFSIGAGELQFQVGSVWTLSLPVVVIVHGNQEPHAWATVSWDNAFAEPGRQCFAVPDRVPWPQVADMLNTKFFSSCGRTLTEDNLKFIAGKVFRNHTIADYSQLQLNWNAFAKEPLPDRNFTFWEWFYGILKLTREHLKNLWNDGLIMGFVGKLQASDMLMKQAVGTFLLRYSDSELGGISIAGFKADTQGSVTVDHLQPWTSKDFAIRSLADRVSDLGSIIYLYPNIPKDQAFQRYYTPPAEAQQGSSGYVKPLLVIHVPGWGTGAGMSADSSYPNTPHYQYPQSPPDTKRENPGSVVSVGSENAGPGQLGDYDLDLHTFMDDMQHEIAPDLHTDFPMDFGSMNLIDQLFNNAPPTSDGST